MLPYFLLVAGIVMLVLFLIARDKKSSVLAIIFKTATSLFFIATGLAAVVENGVVGGFESKLLPSALVVMGLVLGMVGDITLDFKIYFKGLEGKYDGVEKDRDSMMYFGMLGGNRRRNVSRVCLRNENAVWQIPYPEHSVCIFALLVRGTQRNVRQARTRFGIGRYIACRRDTFRALGYGAFDDVFFKTRRL